jgi:hypothetical protein
VKQYALDSNLYIEADGDQSAAEDKDRFLMRFRTKLRGLEAGRSDHLSAGSAELRALSRSSVRCRF